MQYRYVALALCTLAFTATMVARLVISPVVPQITTEFAVSRGAVGLALTGMWAAYALSQFPSGVLADRFGERYVILLAVGLTAVASLLLAAAPNYAVFAVTAVVLGVEVTQAEVIAVLTVLLGIAGLAFTSTRVAAETSTE